MVHRVPILVLAFFFHLLLRLRVVDFFLASLEKGGKL